MRAKCPRPSGTALAGTRPTIRARHRRVELHRGGLGQRHRLPRLRRLDHAEHEVLDVESRDLHLGELQLDELVVADRSPELLAFLRVLDALLETPFDDAE